MIKKEECNRDIRTYGDVIRHMNNDELSLFLTEMGADIELGIIAVMRAKAYPHRKGGDTRLDKNGARAMYSFMAHRVSDEDENYGDVWGIENWQDLMQWEWPGKKNFGMDVVF